MFVTRVRVPLAWLIVSYLLPQAAAAQVVMAPGAGEGFEETGSVSRHIPGIVVSAQSLNSPNHTYEMDVDNLKEIGHKGFTIDAETTA